MMKHIMVATDLSERSDCGLRRATLLARQWDVDITLVNVVDEDRPRRIVEEERREALSLLQDMAATLRTIDGVRCKVEVVLGEPSQAVIQVAAAMAPDLLVIGPHRRQLFRDVFIGTTAERTIRATPCPVLMVNAAPAAPYRHVLLTTDLSDGSRAAIASYVGLGIAGTVAHSILHVFDAPMLGLALPAAMDERDRQLYIEEERQKAALALETFRASTAAGHATPLLLYEQTTAKQEILSGAADVHADLIVLATHGKSGLQKLLRGSVTEQVLRDSAIDVLAIPPAAAT
jgi:nucleotide-binding universal stress UspA family protein